MKIGDIVTRRVAGDVARYCVVGFYTDQQTDDRVAIVAPLDPQLVVEVPIRDLAPVSFSDLIALTAGSCLWH